jgi:hypothetical protein
LTEEDFVQLGRCRRPHNRLGFAYQVAFVRLFNRFPQQPFDPFELLEKLVCFSAAQLGLDAELIELYRKRQPTQARTREQVIEAALAGRGSPKPCAKSQGVAVRHYRAEQLSNRDVLTG